MLKFSDMRIKAFYKAPENKVLDLGPETNFLNGSPQYGDSGKAGADLNEMDELGF